MPVFSMDHRKEMWFINYTIIIRLMRVIICLITILAFIYYSFLSGLAIYYVKTNKIYINENLNNLKKMRIKYIFSLVFALSMIIMFIMSILGVSFNIITIIMMPYSFILMTISSLNLNVFLTKKDIMEIKKTNSRRSDAD